MDIQAEISDYVQTQDDISDIDYTDQDVQQQMQQSQIENSCQLQQQLQKKEQNNQQDTLLETSQTSEKIENDNFQQQQQQQQQNEDKTKEYVKKIIKSDSETPKQSNRTIQLNSLLIVVVGLIVVNPYKNFMIFENLDLLHICLKSGLFGFLCYKIIKSSYHQYWFQKLQTYIKSQEQLAIFLVTKFFQVIGFFFILHWFLKLFINICELNFLNSLVVITTIVYLMQYKENFVQFLQNQFQNLLICTKIGKQRFEKCKQQLRNRQQQSTEESQDQKMKKRKRNKKLRKLIVTIVIFVVIFTIFNLIDGQKKLNEEIQLLNQKLLKQEETNLELIEIKSKNKILLEQNENLKALNQELKSIILDMQKLLNELSDQQQKWQEQNQTNQNENKKENFKHFNIFKKIKNFFED